MAQGLVNILPLGAAIHQYLTATYENISSLISIGDIKTLRIVTEEIDSNIRPVIRTLQSLEKEQQQSAYLNIVESELLKHNLNKRSLLEEFRNQNFLRDLNIKHIFPDLIVDVGKNFNKIIFRYDSNELVVNDPKLLWDCHCLIPIGNFNVDDRPIDADNFKCPIHDSELGQEVASRFRSGLVLIKYDETHVYWCESKEFWPPSIDTFFMLDNMKKDGVFEKQINSVLDLGSGTGFLGISIVKNLHSVDTLQMSDWLLTPVIFSKINWELNKGNKTHIRSTVHLGMEMNWINSPNVKIRYDLLVCNPPYLPDLDKFPEIRQFSTVGGTDLLEYIIREGLDFSKEIYVNFSDIALKEVKTVTDEGKVRLVKVGNSHKVPFRVPQALRVKDYMNELVKERGLEISEYGRFKYWHTLNTYKVIKN